MPLLTRQAFTNALKSKSKELGFQACGIAEAGFLEEDAARLRPWLDKNRHGEMKYMENYFDKRTDPSKLLPGAKSVIVLLYSYYPEKSIETENNYKISKYAYGADYHFVIKKKLKELIQFLTAQHAGCSARAFVDSAPVLERAWAQKAGLGWIGKNTCLITKEKGSYFFIAEIITDLILDYDHKAVPNHCGGCTRCLNACPTGALDPDGLDATRCISYLTIEYRNDQLPAEYRGQMNDWIFGCDICQDVCPWNRLSEPHNQPEFNAGDNLRAMRKKDWEDLDEPRFRELFRGSAVKRTTFKGLKRNIGFAALDDLVK